MITQHSLRSAPLALGLALVAALAAAAGVVERAGGGSGSVAPGSPDVTGRWTGVIELRPGENEVDFALDLKRRPDGTLGGSVVFLLQDGPPQELDSVERTGDEIAFSTHDSDQIVSTFHGRVTDGNQIAGDFVERGAHYAWSVKRGALRAPVPDGRREVHELRPSSDELVRQFNRDRGNVRVLAILSPTCPMCRTGARILERYVLDGIADPSLRVYLVWEHIHDADDRAQAEHAASFAPDARVTSYWSTSRQIGEAFQRVAGFKSSPAWDVFLVFPRNASWDAAEVPRPAAAMCNLMGTLREPTMPPRLNGLQLAAQIRSQLGAAATTGAGRR